MRQNPVSLRERIPLDHTSSVPLHRQIYQWVCRAILEGQLQPRQNLPSTRTLASELGVSRNMASTAYEQLHAEGYVERTVGSGTTVAPFFPARDSSAPVASWGSSPGSHPDPSSFGRAVQSRSVPAFLLRPPASEPPAFRVGTPALDQFPYL